MPFVKLPHIPIIFTVSVYVESLSEVGRTWWDLRFSWWEFSSYIRLHGVKGK